MSRLSLKIAVQSFLLVYLLRSVVLSNSNSGVRSLKTKCIDEERRALLKFKDNLESYDNDTLSSWGYEEEKKDCCSWEGVGCDNITGHVIMLDLSHLGLRTRGKYMSPPLIELGYLNYLDLSGNGLYENNLLSLIGNSMVSLQHLDLSETLLDGSIPETFWTNMTSLSHLILYSNGLGGSIPQGFCNVASLRYLDLSGNLFISSIPKCLGNMTLFEHLDLSHNDLVGSIPEAFGNLVTLTYLNLSTNHLNDSIPKFLGNMTLLKFLDLHDNSFNGSIPKAFGNMATLTYLDLGMNYFKGSVSITFENQSSTLKYLALDSNQLEGVITNSFCKKLTSLVFLDLNKNKLEGSIPKCFGKNLTSLVYLDLSKNKLEGSIPECFGNNMMLLTYLALGNNQLEGPIPEAFGNMSALEKLDLRNNKLTGEIPTSVWNICTLRELFLNSNNLSGQLLELTQSSSSCTNHSLQRLFLHDNRITGLFPSLRLFSSLVSLDISSNQLNGSVDPSIGQLSELVFLNISNNLLEGVISKAHFSQLSKLIYLDLSSNKLIFNVSYAWIPPFRLRAIYLSSCKLGPQFPRWLQSQEYSRLDISNTGISDSIPSWFWDHKYTIDRANVSNNQLSGMIGNYSMFIADVIDLSSNQLEGAVPTFLFEAASLLSLSRNKFSSINSMCGVTDAMLKVLDISHNQLSGKLSNCWSQFDDLVVLNLANNYELSGEIPTSIGSLTNINSLRLSNNKFTGELPLSLKECKNLVVFDVGGNKLSGAIPTWIGETLQDLVILNLRSNHLYGSIPSSLCHLPHLQLLDLSINNISGSIPKCLNNLSEMRSSYTANTSTIIQHFYYTFPSSNEDTVAATYVDRIEVMWKGVVSEYGNTLGLVKGIDLSTNMLNGEIPPEITELVGLIYFNLSRNNLSGQIPAEIGNLESLDFLDLSNNQFSGQIPPTLRLIYRLSVLNLSNNNLSGKIPTSTQLQSFNADAYIGNIGLCGAPLPAECPEEEQPRTPPTTEAEEDHNDGFISQEFYVSMGVGYVVGFWGVFGTLLFNKSWRCAYFKLWQIGFMLWLHCTRQSFSGNSEVINTAYVARFFTFCIFGLLAGVISASSMRRGQKEYYSTYHKMQNRKKFTNEEWNDFTQRIQCSATFIVFV
nr:receptor-like protein EIX1 [Ziziphus jujuba var. spinosa]